MEKYRIGNDIKVKWVIFRNGKQPEDFTKATIQELRLNNVTSGDSLLPTYSVSGNVITVEYPASQQKKAGVFTLTLKYTKKLSPASTEDQYTIDKENAFEIVAQTRFEESDPEIPGVIESFVYRNRDGKDGATPDIGKNENWWLNGKDTGKPSRGRAFASSDFTEAEWNELKKPSLDAAGVATDAAIRCEDAISTTNDVKASTIVVRDETSRVKSETNAVKLATEDVKNQTEASKGACDEATSQSITQTGNAQKATAETIKSSILATDAAGNFDKAIVQTYPTVEPTTKTTVINAQDTFKKFKEQEGKMAQLEQDVNENTRKTNNIIIGGDVVESYDVYTTNIYAPLELANYTTKTPSVSIVGILAMYGVSDCKAVKDGLLRSITGIFSGNVSVWVVREGAFVKLKDVATLAVATKMSYDVDIAIKAGDYVVVDGSYYATGLGNNSLRFWCTDGALNQEPVLDAVTLSYSFTINYENRANYKAYKVACEDIDTLIKKRDHYGDYINLHTDDYLSNAWIATGWVKSSEKLTCQATGLANYVRLNKVYHSDKRFVRFKVKMATDTLLRLPVSYGSINGGEGATLFTVDFAKKILMIHGSGNDSDSQPTSSGYNISSELVKVVIPDDVIGNRDYYVEIHKDSTTHIIKLYDTLTGVCIEAKHTGWAAGRQNQYYSAYVESGGLVEISDFKVYSIFNPDVVFVGDSITEGVMVIDRSKRYAEQFRLNNPTKKVVISARGGDNIDGVLAKFETEFNIYKPKKMVVLIGANGGNTLAKLQLLKAKCDSIGCELYLNYRTCQQSSDAHIAGNALIAQLALKGARFDIATAVDYIPTVDASHPSPRYNSSLYYDAGLHPNNQGNAKMYERLRIDVPNLSL